MRSRLWEAWPASPRDQAVSRAAHTWAGPAARGGRSPHPGPGETPAGVGFANTQEGRVSGPCSQPRPRDARLFCSCLWAEPIHGNGLWDGAHTPTSTGGQQDGQCDVPTGAHSVATVTRGVQGREQGLPGSLLPGNQERRGPSFSPFRSVQPVRICGDLLCARLPWRAQTGCSWPGPAPGRGQAAGHAPSSTCTPWGSPSARECDPSRRGHHLPPLGACGARGPAPRGRRALTCPRNVPTAKARFVSPSHLEDALGFPSMSYKICI